MDRQLAERMLGAAVLLGALVLVVPAILDGGGAIDAGRERATVVSDLDLRSHTIQIDASDRRPPVPSVSSPPLPVPAAPAPPLPAAGTSGGDPGPATGSSIPDATEERAAVALAAGTQSPPPPSPLPTPGAGEGSWGVQLGVFANRTNADRLAQAVGEQGFAVDIIEGRGSKGPLYRVRVGGFATRAAAGELATKLAVAGFPGTVARQ